MIAAAGQVPVDGHGRGRRQLPQQQPGEGALGVPPGQGSARRAEDVGQAADLGRAFGAGEVDGGAALAAVGGEEIGGGAGAVAHVGP